MNNQTNLEITPIMTATELFRQAMSNAGVEPPADTLADGMLHRFTVSGDKPRSNNGWYVLHTDDPAAGAFGCWKRQISETWNGKTYQSMTPTEKAAYTAKMEAMKRQQEEELQRIQEKCRAWCAEIWKSAKDATNKNPYLKRKCVNAYGLKSFKGSLLIPVQDMAGTLHGLQFIGPDGSKKFKTGTNKTGHFFKIGKSKSKIVIVCEGYATGASIHQATGHAVVVSFDAGNLLSVAQVIRSMYPDMKIIIAADNDQWTEENTGIAKATEAARKVGGLLAIPAFKGVGHDKPTDFNDLHSIEGLEAVRLQIEAATMPTLALAIENATQAEIESNVASSRLRVIDAVDFMALEFPPRENILSPWLPTQGLTMVYAIRGIGKTHFSLGVAYATTSGGNFFTWQAPVPRGVLFLDGEMPASVLQERLARIAVSSDKEPIAPLRIITPDLQPRGMIDLTRSDDQKELLPYLDGIDLIIVDNLSTLCRAGKENEGESWLPVQAWALQQRAAGRSVLFIHHAGKNGEQRGTSRREDVLDTVIALKRPGDYTPDKGACFEVHFEKARGIFGEDTKPFEAQLLTTPDGRQTWTMKALEDSTVEKVAKLLNEGIPQHEIAELLRISKGAVSKAKKKAGRLGLLKAVS